MRNRKLLYALIPLIIVVVILIVGVIFLILNSKPEKIFETSISKIFEMIETEQEQFTSMKGIMNLTANIESEDEDIQTLNEMLESSNIGLNMEIDTKNMIINESASVTFNNESLLNAIILLQDQKGYVYLKDWLDKYLQIPEDDFKDIDLTEYYNKLKTLDLDGIMEAIKEQLTTSILAQELVQENTTVILNGEETKVTASVLSLKGEERTTFTKDLLSNLKENEKFQTSLGSFKDDIISGINKSIQILNKKENFADNMQNEELLNEIKDIENNREFKFIIYTKGFLNEFVGVSIQQIDYKYTRTDGIDLLKHNKEKYELVSYTTSELARQDNLNLVIENKKEDKNKGTATIIITVDEEQLIVTYNYEIQGNQTTFILATEIEGVGLTVSGNVIENGKNIKGNITASVQEESFGKVNMDCNYDFTYDIEIQKVNVGNAVLIDELSEEDQTTFMTNFQNSSLYQLIEQIGLLDSGLEIFDEPEVTYDGYTVKYTVPENFEISEYSSEDYKMYMDDNYNSVYVMIESDLVDDYMNDLDNEYVLTSNFYKNQKISETRNYPVNGKEYKFRTITYSDEFGSYVDLYFAYGLDDEHCYIVEIESEGGNISRNTIENFLDVTVTKQELLPTDNIASTGEEIIDILQ